MENNAAKETFWNNLARVKPWPSNSGHAAEKNMRKPRFCAIELVDSSYRPSSSCGFSLASCVRLCARCCAPCLWLLLGVLLYVVLSLRASK